MGSQSSNKIPVINFLVDDLSPGSSSWCSLRNEVHRALEVYGSFEAVFGDKQLHHKMLQAVDQLFDLPLEIRQKYPSTDRFSGNPRPDVPLWRNTGLTDVLDPGRLQEFTDILWPEGNPFVYETVDSYVRQAAKLEQMVRAMVFESFGVKNYYQPLVAATTYWLRINQYRVPEPNETNLGLGVHTDTSIITILSQNDVHGLEMQAKDGEWINVTPAPATYVVLAGDGFRAWSNDRLHSPPHRVLMNTESMRYSLAVFAYIKGTIVKTPEELVDEEHPLLYKPFDHMGYRAFISTKEGQRAESAIKTYCGV